MTTLQTTQTPKAKQISKTERLIKQLKKLNITDREFANLMYEVKQQVTLENRFPNGVTCPVCGEKDIQKFGKCNKIQRYRCKDCGKTFSEYTKTVFSSTKKDYFLWVKYIDLMMKGASLYIISKKLNISVVTAFKWRHKILNAVKKYQTKTQVYGVVEADETFLFYSHKGQHIEGVKGRERGGVGKYRDISKDQIGVLVAIDRNKNIISQMYGGGRITSKLLEEILGKRIEKDTILVTDSCKSYIRFAEEHNLQLKQITRKKHKNGKYHINNVNAYHKGLKKFLLKFNGISTKYLNNYLNWFSWTRTGLDNSKLIKQCLLGN